METTLAKALFDNTAESPDELAFHKGDVVTVLERTVEGSEGWWRCSFDGREGLAPANRLRLLSKVETGRLALSNQNIYETPKVQQTLESGQIYEVMNRFCKVPSTQQANTLEKSNTSKRHSPRPMERKPSLMLPADLQKFEMLKSKRTPHQSNVYNVPTLASSDPNYDIPSPSTTKLCQKLSSGYSTMPIPRKSEWIYDIPTVPEIPTNKPDQQPYCTLPSKGVNSDNHIYDTIPARVWSTATTTSLYDIPQCSVTAQQKTNTIKPNAESIYDVPPCRQPMPIQQTVNLSESEKAVEPLEYRGKHGLRPDYPRGRPSWTRNRQLRDREATIIENEVEKFRGLSVAGSQRISTVSTSSSSSGSSRSSCDSMMLSSPSPEPLKEITLSQEEATQRLLELQEAVCRAVPKLMEFVSSRWRSREHLGKHLQEIRAASEDVAHSVTGFLNFALDVRGNAQRLTDSNLQSRLQKQLSTVEDSGLILQKSVDDLGCLGWPLDVLAQDLKQPQTPDQLERFVTVARMIPEDVKRLVSIVNANSKLLFKNTSKEPESLKSASPPDVRKSLGRNNLPKDKDGDYDYVQLQTLPEFEQQQQRKAKDRKEDTEKQALISGSQTLPCFGKQQLKKAKDSIKLDKKDDNAEKQTLPVFGKQQQKEEKDTVKPEKKEDPEKQDAKPETTSPACSKSHISDHCRLYFGAIKKAISVYVNSLEEGQPPENFISHSKLVIMVGQRLINTLCTEAQRRQDGQELLCKSNHLCALLKQLAVATKKAALHFPDKGAVQEAQDFAKELAQKAQHFRMSLEV
ncbi:cas scaffolding protein family member 4 [Trichomycterus rosablanca]|uniref:cas scaffolding protein family member 4 n=1 Tax=Trichomycterus rosablanca TaxID=2290929 RepID=UPI002F35DEDC